MKTIQFLAKKKGLKLEQGDSGTCVVLPYGGCYIPKNKKDLLEFLKGY